MTTYTYRGWTIGLAKKGSYVDSLGMKCTIQSGDHTEYCASEKVAKELIDRYEDGPTDQENDYGVL